MKTKLFFLVTLLAIGGSLFAQGQNSSLSNPVGGAISVSGANCAVANVCVWQKLPSTATTTTVTITGTFSATLIVESSGDGGTTWTQQSSQTAATVVTFTTASLTDVRVRCSAFVSGAASVNIQTAGTLIISASNGATPTVISASAKGAALNTSLTAGGGTDDTATLQAILNVVPTGGLELIIDGPALVTGLNVLSNTRIRCMPGGGLFLKANSNREVIRNVNRSGSTRTDTNLSVIDCYMNGNGPNQSTGSNQADHTVMSIIGFYGVNGIYLARNHLFQSAAYQVNLDNVGNVLDDDNWYETSSTLGNLTRDGIDVRGPAENITIRKARIKSGDDCVALNTRPYTSLIAGPYNLGGNITGVLIEDISLDPGGTNGSWGGVDIISDGSFYTDDITIRRVNGKVQNYAVFLSVDRGNSPTGNGDHRDIFIEDINVNQVGTPFGSFISPGLFPIDANVSNVRFQSVRAGGPMAVPTLTTNANISILSIDEQRYTVLTGSAFVISTNPVEQFAHPNGALPLPWITLVGNSHSAIAPTITSGVLQGTTSVLQMAVYGNVPTLNPAQFSEITITNSGGDASSAEYASFRIQPVTQPLPSITGTFNQYDCYANNGSIFLRKWAADVSTPLANAVQAVTAGDTIKGVANGSSLSCLYNNVLAVGPITDATFPTGGVGMGVLGSGSHAAISRWNGGSIVTTRSGPFIADQGIPCTNAEIVLSAGWGNTAATTTATGSGQTCEWTLTSAGTGQAANPTITDTLTNALPNSRTICEMRMVGGTGTATLIDQTTASATVPVFTFIGTPVAASTYKVVRRCGP